MESISSAFYIGLVCGVLVACLFVVWWRRRSSYPQKLSRVVKKISRESLSDVVVPDGLDGEIQIEKLLLTNKGLLVLDVKEIRGRFYGSDNMDEWTVINNSQRFTFTNPAGPLRERVIAIKTLLEDVPVLGRVVILGDVELSKGMPQCVVNLEQLLEEFGSDDKNARTSIDAYYPHWDKLRQIAVTA